MHSAKPNATDCYSKNARKQVGSLVSRPATTAISAEFIFAAAKQTPGAISNHHQPLRPRPATFTRLARSFYPSYA